MKPNRSIALTISAFASFFFITTSFGFLRTAAMDFLLSKGLTRRWIVGSCVVTVTTSGTYIDTDKICENCLPLNKRTKASNTDTATVKKTIMDNTAADAGMLKKKSDDKVRDNQSNTSDKRDDTMIKDELTKDAASDKKDSNPLEHLINSREKAASPVQFKKNNQTGMIKCFAVYLLYCTLFPKKKLFW